MTANKDFKRLVRTRMKKTGESYTAARAQLRARKPVTSVPTAPTPVDYAKLTGKSDATIKAKTGCTWERWVKALDYAKAHTWTHREIAKYVMEKYKIPGWWAQTVTVGYERIKGLRDVNQRRDGSFEANKSRTFHVPVSRLFDAFHDARLRARWLPDVKLKVRTSVAPEYMRVTWPDETSVVVGFTAIGAAKSQVAVQHEKLRDKAAVLRTKEFWAGRFDELKEVLG